MDFIRGISKYQPDYTSRHVYYFFQKFTRLYPQGHKKDFKVSESQFNKVFRMFTDRISDEMIDNFFAFKMPYGLGSLYIRSYKQQYRINEETGKLKIKKTMLDVVAMRELWKVDEEARKNRTVVLKNYDHSDDVIYKVRWTKPNLRFVNNKFYLFKPSRVFRKKIYEACMNGNITSY